MLAVRLDLRCETARLPGVAKYCVAITGGGVGVRKVDEQAGTGSNKFIWEMSEGGGELVDRVECADAGESISALAI